MEAEDIKTISQEALSVIYYPKFATQKV